MFLILTLAALASADWTCEECERVFRAIVDIDTSEDGINQQVEILLAEVCPAMENPEECVAELPGFWMKLAPVLWPFAFNPEALCSSLCKPEVRIIIRCRVCTLLLIDTLET